MKMPPNSALFGFLFGLMLVSHASAESCLVNIVSNVREGISGTTHTATYDLAQYYVFNDGRAPQLVQRISGTGYTNDAPGTSASRTLYAAKVQWMRWAQGAYTIPESNRPSWLPVSDKKLEPITSTTYGTWWLKVSSGSSDPSNPPASTNMVSILMLQSAVYSVTRQSIGLNTYSWNDLALMPSKNVRSFFSSLSGLVVKKTGLSYLGELLDQAGYKMAELSDLKRLLKSTIKADQDYVASQLRAGAQDVRTLRWKIEDAYRANFTAGTSPGMIKQFEDFSIDYEKTMRAAEGNWSMYPPTWTRYANGRPAFIDFPSAGQIDDSAFPRIKVMPGGPYLIIEPDHDPNSQVFTVENTGKRYRMTYVRTTPTKLVKFEVEVKVPQRAFAGVIWVSTWVPSGNPLE